MTDSEREDEVGVNVFSEDTFAEKHQLCQLRPNQLQRAQTGSCLQPLKHSYQVACFIIFLREIVVLYIR